MCDNCKNTAPVKEQDFTKEAASLLKLIQSAGGRSFVMSHWIQVWRGSKVARIKKEKHNELEGFGSGKAVDRNHCDRIAMTLIMEGYLEEQIVQSVHGSSFAYVTCSPKANSLINGNAKLKLLIRTKAQLRTAVVRDEDSSKADSPEKQLKALLLNKRSELGQENAISKDLVLKTASLELIAKKRPVTWEQMKAIEGISQVQRNRYALEFLKVVREFCSTKLKECEPLSIEEEESIRKEISNSANRNSFVISKKRNREDEKQGKSLNEDKSIDLTDEPAGDNFFDDLTGEDLDNLLAQYDDEPKHDAKKPRLTRQQHSPHQIEEIIDSNDDNVAAPVDNDFPISNYASDTLDEEFGDKEMTFDDMIAEEPKKIVVPPPPAKRVGKFTLRKPDFDKYKYSGSKQ